MNDENAFHFSPGEKCVSFQPATQTDVHGGGEIGKNAFHFGPRHRDPTVPWPGRDEGSKSPM